MGPSPGGSHKTTLAETKNCDRSMVGGVPDVEENTHVRLRPAAKIRFESFQMNLDFSATERDFSLKAVKIHECFRVSKNGTSF